MKFDKPLINGILLKRYKRFLADIRLLESNQEVVAHVPNSGSMLGVSDPGSPCLVSISDNPSRKYRHTLEMVKIKSGAWVGVNTARTNSLVLEAFQKKKVTDWDGFEEIRPEVKINKETRLDFLLTAASKRCYVEVKNVSMAQPPWAVFPDAVTVRGQKHLRELIKLRKKGHRSEIFFVVQRNDCRIFRPCDEIDSDYGMLLRKAAALGVVVRCWSCEVSETGIEITREIPVDCRSAWGEITS